MIPYSEIGEPAAYGLFAHRHVVVLRAGEVLEQVAVALGRHDAQVEAQAVVRDHGRLRPALGNDLDDPIEAREGVDQRPRVVAVAIMSRSRNVSRRRRTLPASETRSRRRVLA